MISLSTFGPVWFPSCLCCCSPVSPIPSWDLKSFPQTKGQSCKAGPLWAQEGFYCVSTELCPELRLSPVVMQEGSCSAPLAKRGHFFIFIFFNHRKCCVLDDLQLSSEKQKGSKLFLFQKVKLLSDVSKKPIPNSRPALNSYLLPRDVLFPKHLPS